MGRRLIDNLDELVIRVKQAQVNTEIVSIAFIGNIVDVWERFDIENIYIHVGSDQTSLQILGLVVIIQLV